MFAVLLNRLGRRTVHAGRLRLMNGLHKSMPFRGANHAGLGMVFGASVLAATCSAAITAVLSRPGVKCACGALACS
jgi:hypothetical protein